MFTLFFFHPLSLVHSLYIARAHLPLWVICLWIGLVFCCRANCSSFCHQPLQDNASVSRAVLKFRRHTDACSTALLVETREVKNTYFTLETWVGRGRVYDIDRSVEWRSCSQSSTPLTGVITLCMSLNLQQQQSVQLQVSIKQGSRFNTELFRGLNYFRFLETYRNWSLVKLPPWLTWTISPTNILPHYVSFQWYL